MTNELKHTPGPWYVCDEHEGTIPIDAPPSSTDRDDSVEICRVSYDSETEQEANAALIAAAPDLLEACQYALAQSGLSVDSPSYKKLQAAIAKAEGLK